MNNLDRDAEIAAGIGVDLDEFNDVIGANEIIRGAASVRAHRKKQQMSTIIGDIDGLESIRTEIVEDFTAETNALHSAWIYFRMSNIESLKKYGPPLDDTGAPLQDVPELTIDINLTTEWFKTFISMPICKILRIETALGGLLIRKSSQSDHCLHKFTCADLPPDPYRKVTVINFDAIRMAGF